MGDSLKKLKIWILFFIILGLGILLACDDEEIRYIPGSNRTDPVGIPGRSGAITCYVARVLGPGGIPKEGGVEIRILIQENPEIDICILQVLNEDEDN